MPIEKVFVYCGENTSPYCVQDATAFFTAYGVFGKPDVRLTDALSENFSGLDPSKIAVVVPGGAAIFMSMKLKGITILPALLKAGAHYIGFCAGAYLALNTLIYEASHKVINENLELPRQRVAEGDIFSFDLSKDYSAMGPFYPDATYYLDWQRQYRDDYTTAQFRDANKPYVTDLTFRASDDFALPALYVAGCGFKSRGIMRNEMHVLATYPQQSYRFLNCVTPYSTQYREEKIETLPAIIARKPNAERKQGGVLLSGPHIEASVPDSSMVRFFSTRSEGRILLDDTKMELLKNNREALQTEAVRLVNETFGYR